MKESMIQRGILDFLQMKQNHGELLYYFRSAAGQVRTGEGRVFKTGKPGCPDISVVFQGRYIGLEVKTATGRQSAVQKQAEAEIKAAGGEYHIVRSISDAKEILK